jgi:hypothetical protein
LYHYQDIEGVRMEYLSESRNSGIGDLMASGSNFEFHDLAHSGLADTGLTNKSFQSLSATSLTAGNTTSSSKAVLAALRALQDKIRRLESERSQALDEVAQLRMQLKNQEIEADHQRQRDLLSTQKNIQDAKVSQERLQQEKMELEIRLQRLEDKIRLSHQSSEELQTKIRVLEDEKHSANLKIRDLEHSHHQMEQQIKSAQIKEKDMVQTLTWETKHHEEEVTLLNNRVSALQEELARVGHEKGNLDGRIVELDQLVGQLLALNENLVAQLAGKPWKALTPALTTKKVTKVKKASNTSSVPRVASLSTTSKKPLAKSIDLNDIDQLRSLHKAYAKMASSLTRTMSPATKSPYRSKKTIVSEVNHSIASLGSSRGSTRLGRKKKASSASSDEHHSRPTTPISSSGAFSTPMQWSDASHHSAGVRIPKPAVYFDGVSGDLNQQDTSMHRSYLTTQQIDVSQLRSPALSQSPATAADQDNYRASQTSKSSFPMSSNANPSSGFQSQSQDELKDMISSLEEEFNDLNRQYRRLLSNVSASSTEVPESLSEQSIDARAQEIVKVIQKLHEKGEQLRVLKSPTK